MKRKREGETTNLNALPFEVLLHILKRLHPWDAVSLLIAMGRRPPRGLWDTFFRVKAVRLRSQMPGSMPMCVNVEREIDGHWKTVYQEDPRGMTWVRSLTVGAQHKNWTITNVSRTDCGRAWISKDMQIKKKDFDPVTTDAKLEHYINFLDAVIPEWRIN